MQKQLIFACLFTGVYDVNRSETLPNNDYSLIEKWTNSIIALELHGVVFHNSFSPEIEDRFSNEYITFKYVNYDPIYNLSVYRYFVYHNFLLTHQNQIESIFITDITDVEVLNNPFLQPLFINNPGALFCGDEPTTLLNEWMMKHSTHFRNQISEFSTYEEKFTNETLLNCGIVGGNIITMSALINELVQFHEQYNKNNKTAYTGDMGAFNFIVRSKFNKQLFHGNPVNTVFKSYEINNTDCWFRHK